MKKILLLLSIIGLVGLVISFVQPTVVLAVPTCQNNPEGIPAPGQTWKAFCGGPACQQKSDCAAYINNWDSNIALPSSDSYWCYGFDGPNKSSQDFRCMQLIRDVCPEKGAPGCASVTATPPAGDFSCKLELDASNSNNLYGGKFLGKVIPTGTKPADAQLYCLIDGKQAAGNPRSSDYCDILGVAAGQHTMKAYYYTNGGNTLLASCGQIQATVNTGPAGGSITPTVPPGGFNTNPCYIQLVKPEIVASANLSPWGSHLNQLTWVEGSASFMNNLYVPQFGPLQGPRIAWNYAMAGVRAQGAGGKGTLQDLDWLSQRLFNKSWTQVQTTEQQNSCPFLPINDACNSNAANNPLAQCPSGQTCHITTQTKDASSPPSYTCTAPGKITPTITKKPTNTKTPTPTPTGKTTHYKMVEAANDNEAAQKLQTAPEVVYDSLNHTDPVKLSYTFEDNTPGFKNLYFQFIDKSVSPIRTSDIIHKRIRLLGGKPELTSIKCEYDSASDVGTVITIKGHNFGNENKNGIKVASQSATILSWTDQIVDDGSPAPTASSTATISPSASATVTATPSVTATVRPSKTITPSRQPVWGILGAKVSNSQVKARIDSRPSGNIKVSLTTFDGQIVTGTCRIGLTTLDFTSTLQCRTKDNFNASNVDIKIFEKDGNKKPLVNEKVDFDLDGRPIDFAPVLEAGKRYVMVVKAPQTLAKKIEFTAEDGTVTIPNIYMPVGDIHPLDFADGIINTLDKGELIREWSTSIDTVRAGDFNSDTRVNSIDYSCLLLNFNKSDDKL